MASSTEPSDLALVGDRLVDQPTFLASWLAASPPSTVSTFQRRLGLSAHAMELLRLCRAPRQTRFIEDVENVAGYIGADADVLAASLRELTAITALAQTHHPLAEFSSYTAPLAAAHDAAVEPMSRSDRRTQQLRELATNVWNETPERHRDPSRLEDAVPWALPAAVVGIDNLTLQGAAQWLAERGVAVEQLPPRRVYGLLVAWRGVALIFVDNQLNSAWRRFVIAHEVGHLLLDHLQPRQKVLRQAPDLLDVVDGHRPASRSDRAQAVLARVPLSVHTHLLARDPHGGTEEQVGVIEDDASRFALELLAPWEAAVAAVQQAVDYGVSRSDAIPAATDAIARRFSLPDLPAQARAAMVLDQLKIRRSFFER